MYRIEFSALARRQIRAFAERAPRPDVERLSATISSLATEPRPHGVQKIRGQEKTYRVRSGDYRVTYDIYDQERVVLIAQVLRRNERTYRI